MTPGRLETFADGVFAIAATLLILNVELPQPSTGTLGDELLRLWPAYLAYGISFLTIGVIWVNHHNLLRHLRHADRTFLFLNVGFLLVVAFIPFPTRLLADYVRTEDGRAAALAYGAVAVVMALFFNALWLYASSGRRLLRDDVGPARGERHHAQLPRRAAHVRSGDPRRARLAGTAAALFGLIALFYVLSSSLFGRAEEG